MNDYPSTDKPPSNDVQWIIWRSQFYMLMFGSFSSGMVVGMLFGILMVLKFV